MIPRSLAIPSLSGKRLNRIALQLGLGYLILCTLYIIVSGELALAIAQSPQQLAVIERYKGIAFVIFSSLLFYAAARFLVARILKQEDELVAQRRLLLEAEMRGAAGLMAASVAHDIKNVLTLFNFQLYLLQQGQSEHEARGTVIGKLTEAVDRLNSLAMRLLALSRNGMGEQAQREDIVAVVRDNMEFLRLHRAVRSCRLELEANAAIEMNLHRGLIDQMMLNLLINAAEAVEGRGAIQVRITPENGWVVIEVHDDGPGIKHDQGSVFDAFYTTKASGHGLGLYTVKACAEIHGGHVAVTGSHLGGACFQVRLPLNSTAAAPATSRESESKLESLA